MSKLDINVKDGIDADDVRAAMRWLLPLITIAVLVITGSYTFTWLAELARFCDALGAFACAGAGYVFGDFIVLRGLNTKEQLKRGNTAYAMVLIAFPALALLAYATS